MAHAVARTEPVVVEGVVESVDFDNREPGAEWAIIHLREDHADKATPCYVPSTHAHLLNGPSLLGVRARVSGSIALRPFVGGYVGDVYRIERL